MRNSESWYNSLAKPSWAPDEAVYGQVWSVLYPIIFAVNVYVIYLLIQKKISFFIILPFWLNLIFNVVYTPVQFGLRNYFLASVIIICILLTIIWAMVTIWPYAKWTSIAFIPYLLWVSIASVLQISIALKN